MATNLSGSTTAVFIVTLSAALEKAVNVGWSTADGTGKAGIDYEAANGTVTFEAGETAKQIQVIVYGREEGESSESRTFKILLTPPENAILDQELTEVTITVTDSAGTPVTSVMVATGPRGRQGDPGLSAYQLAVNQGEFEGTLAEWLEQERSAKVNADRAQQAVNDVDAKIEVATGNAVNLAKEQADRSGQEANRSTAAADRAETAQALGKPYDDVTAAQAAITAGTIPPNAYFNVRGDELYYVNEYQNVNGTATLVPKRGYPGAELVRDIDGRVPKNPGSLMSDVSYPLISINEEVVLWLINGKIESLALGDNLLASLGARAIAIDDANTLADEARIPLIVVNGEVVAWLDHGKFCTMDLQLEGANALSPQVTKKFLPAFSTGNTLYRWNAKRAKLDNGQSATLKLLFTGDSWTDFGTIPQQFADAFYALYGKASDGWASVAGNGTDPLRKMYLNSMGLTRSTGWTNWAIGSPETTPPPFGGGPDGYCMYTSLSTASATLSGAEGTQIDIYHRNSGTFRYRVDGGAWNIVTTGETDATVKTSITGLSDGSHSVDIDTTGNSSVVAIYAFRPHSPGKKGVEVLKVGHAGSRGLHYTYQVSPYIQKFAADLDPDVVVIILGTNDYRTANSNTANYVAGIASIVAAYRAAHADVGIVMVAPADTNAAPASAPLVDFVAAARKFAVDEGIEFVDLNAMMPKWATANGLGLFNDALHMSSAGAQFFLNIVKDKLL